MAETIEVPRTGDRPLAFSGEQLAEESTKWWAGKDNNRWHELALNTTRGGKWVVAIGYRTQWEGEIAHDSAFVCDTPEDAAEILRGTIPTEHLLGFPLGSQYEEKQARLEKQLCARFEAATSKILSHLGPERID